MASWGIDEIAAEVTEELLKNEAVHPGPENAARLSRMLAKSLQAMVDDGLELGPDMLREFGRQLTDALRRRHDA